MNERIKQLAVEAGMIVGEPNGFDMTRLMPKEVKFAELIVRECIEQGDTLAKHYINTHSEQEQVMLLASIADYPSAIKQHFGVEE